LRTCSRSQVAAEDVEQRVLAWLRKPTGKISPEAQTVLTSYAPIWAVLFPETVRRAVAQLVWEVRRDGPMNEFMVVLDDRGSPRPTPRSCGERAGEPTEAAPPEAPTSETAGA